MTLGKPASDIQLVSTVSLRSERQCRDLTLPYTPSIGLLNTSSSVSKAVITILVKPFWLTKGGSTHCEFAFCSLKTLH